HDDAAPGVRDAGLLFPCPAADQLLYPARRDVPRGRDGPRKSGDAMIWRRGEHREEQAAPQSPLTHQEPDQPKQDRREGRRGMAEDRDVTIVGQGAALQGNIASAQSLRIDGQIKGQINSEGDVTLSERSQVEADIAAENATVAGRFKGNIVVKGTAELVRGGRVDGN